MKTARKAWAQLITAGGFTVAQSEETCVVAGMPRAAIVKGYAAKVIPLDNIASFLAMQSGADRTVAASQVSEDKLDKPDKPDKNDKSDKNDSLEKSDKRTVFSVARLIALSGNRRRYVTICHAAHQRKTRSVRYLVVDDSVFARKNLSSR